MLAGCAVPNAHSIFVHKQPNCDKQLTGMPRIHTAQLVPSSSIASERMTFYSAHYLLRLDDEVVRVAVGLRLRSTSVKLVNVVAGFVLRTMVLVGIPAAWIQKSRQACAPLSPDLSGKHVDVGEGVKCLVENMQQSSRSNSTSPGRALIFSKATIFCAHLTFHLHCPYVLFPFRPQI